jgi:hypothetical protein
MGIGSEKQRVLFVSKEAGIAEGMQSCLKRFDVSVEQVSGPTAIDQVTDWAAYSLVVCDGFSDVEIEESSLLITGTPFIRLETVQAADVYFRHAESGSYLSLKKSCCSETLPRFAGDFLGAPKSPPQESREEYVLFPRLIESPATFNANIHSMY